MRKRRGSSIGWVQRGAQKHWRTRAASRRLMCALCMYSLLRTMQWESYDSYVRLVACDLLWPRVHLHHPTNRYSAREQPRTMYEQRIKELASAKSSHRRRHASSTDIMLHLYMFLSASNACSSFRLAALHIYLCRITVRNMITLSSGPAKYHDINTLMHNKIAKK